MAEALVRKAKNRMFPSFSHEKEGEWRGNFIFFQAADTQLGLIDNWNNVPEEQIAWDKEIKLTKEAIKLANEMSPRPKFFIVCGDLVDAMPNAMHREEQEADFKAVFQELDPDIPLVCVCGNHDVGNSPTKESLEDYRRKFGDDYFSFWVGGIFFIVLNSQLYSDNSNAPEEYESQDKWVDEQLKIAKSDLCKHCIVFQHIPWFLNQSDEENEYFNIDLKTRMKMLSKFRDAGVRHIFCGHYHRNAGGFYGDLEVVVTSAIGCQLGNDNSGMRIVRVSEHRIDHKYYDLENFPHSIKLDGNESLP